MPSAIGRTCCAGPQGVSSFLRMEVTFSRTVNQSPQHKRPQAVRLGAHAFARLKKKVGKLIGAGVEDLFARDDAKLFAAWKLKNVGLSTDLQFVF